MSVFTLTPLVPPTDPVSPLPSHHIASDADRACSPQVRSDADRPVRPRFALTPTVLFAPGAL